MGRLVVLLAAAALAPGCLVLATQEVRLKADAQGSTAVCPASAGPGRVLVGEVGARAERSA
jgi:hypothetical protein